MAQLSHLIHVYGALIVFGIVLLEQIGLPIPAFPLLIIAGALAVDKGANWPLFLGASVVACLISDYFWFRAGRFYGKRVLRLLCKISLSPDSCVSQTEDNFTRWGAKSLVVAKFIPGFNTIAPPLAGAMGTSTQRFLWLSVAGGLLWSGVGMGLGAWFHGSVDDVIAWFETLGSTALMVVGALLAVFVLLKYIERRRNLGAADLPRITPDELKSLLEAGHDPLIVDARGVTARQLEAGIPGALVYGDAEPARLMASLDRERHIVVYCTCPNDVTAAQVAKTFIANGFHRARPLRGGLDAWNAHCATGQAEVELKPKVN
ncbi:DedA family protein/thiosulfate sulfurtransferase GlpE [Massilia norwichensis]|jgi:membrane protein DedA with SNARE-associated domain/rhodanese-related sulfurtransferase|uniref:DedA family protein/thiosulfate sulfurtransferase GlpE n=1 Tax=Massilia norwichensis TaxID=1442366 RepID=A0ABT2AD49_9BURK|nr:DedA family protein/thiosulfate sulfurtransferase GlpE [Massilia norwichensis]MCS0592030.1 DedA family protein/thiosulfate sulfurtransferase GlpE [Massilia norwichensis]